MSLATMFAMTVGHAKVNVTENKTQIPDGVEAVDMGLSVKWANMNVGANQFLTKYSTTDRRTQLALSDDAARANWGGEWRMPTVAEYEELTNPANCSWEWTNKDGVNGYKVTSKKTGKSIFFPITGCRFFGEVQFRAINGIYWTSSLYSTNPNKAWCLEFNFEDVSVYYGDLSSNRFSGRCIRAVR